MSVHGVISEVGLNAISGLVLGVAWLAVLGVSLYRYRHRPHSPRRFYIVVANGCLWIGFLLLQVASATAGPVESGSTIVAVGFICVGFGTGGKWLRLRTRNPDTDA